MAEVTLGMLGRINLPCELAVNGQEALQLLRHERFDGILMDCQMPGMDGYQATRAIRRGEAGIENIGIPIIAITASAQEEERKRCLDCGMNGFLSKPFSLEKLAGALAQVFEQNERERSPA